MSDSGKWHTAANCPECEKRPGSNSPHTGQTPHQVGALLRLHGMKALYDRRKGALVWALRVRCETALKPGTM
ncbi:hypothetical protein GALLR39Z86_20470 [Glycomyces algeriensis]|uniref:Uncharacterized protein n=1 Tax=Glycomyces algeriensis TaxID=256037 RepID=A0A9W6G8E2_9ACTN|nr:hypothetical protein GALLR39Z86_20470 [Glycomyces algeriensis]